MSKRQAETHSASEIEVNFTDRAGPVLTDAQYAEALLRIGGVALELRRLASSIHWECGEPAQPASKPTLH